MADSSDGRSNVQVEMDCFDKVSANLAKLSAVLASISGEGFESFRLLADRHQENVLWLAADIACETDALFKNGGKQ
jgi:hypothetical protein